MTFKAGEGRLPGYLADLIRMDAEKHLAPGVYNVDVYHTADCALWRGGVCDCEPDVVVTRGCVTEVLEGNL